MNAQKWLMTGWLGITFMSLPRMPEAQSVAADTGRNDASSEIAEIVVTAQRRSERLQDVPMTVEAFSASQLTTAGIQNLQDLKLLVPGLQVGNAVGFATTHLRGVGSTAIGPGIENPIAVYVDGVYYASTSSALFNFSNVQDIQVLKGPQGTLFGRNATGGLIQITTLEPTQSSKLDAGLTYGNYSTVKADFYAGGGIATNLAADLALQVGHMGQGYGRNYTTGEDVYQNDISVDARSKWVWTPLDTTKVTTLFDFSHQRNSLASQRLIAGQQNLPILAAQPAPCCSPWDTQSDVQPLFENKNGGISIRVDQDLRFAHLMNILAYRQSESHIDFDLDFTAEPFEGAYLQTHENQLSDEVQLSSKSSDGVRWVGGFYYFKSNSVYDPSHVTFDPNPDFSPGFASLSVYGNQGTRSLAPYGQATVTVLPATDLTLGLRYTSERHTLFGRQPLFLADGSTLAETVYPGEERSFSKLTYRIALDHRFSEEIKAYASYNTGFKSGGFNTQSLSDPPYQPETLQASEVGLKADLFNRKLRVDLSGFHYLYSQIQVQRVEGAVTGIINGASATINGADLDLDMRLTSQLSVNGSIEYLEAKFGTFPNAPIGPAGNIPENATIGSAAGNPLPYAPRFAYTLAANYEIPDLGPYKINLNATANHSGPYSFEADGIARQRQYTKYNTAVRLSPGDGRYDISVWGRNLSNVASVEYESTLLSGLRSANYAQPRTYGISFAYHLH